MAVIIADPEELTDIVFNTTTRKIELKNYNGALVVEEADRNRFPRRKLK